jgi:signal transduction histidine kinase
VLLDRRVERNLRLIVLEALHNAAKHARADTVVLAARASRDQIAFRVEDDGRGTPDGSTGGLGLASMRRRAERIAARLAIVSPSGSDRGTQVTVAVELAATRARRRSP